MLHRGDALHTIEGLPLTNENYNKALDLLKNRFATNNLIPYEWIIEIEENQTRHGFNWIA